MKHYNEEAQACYPKADMVDKCNNCARYIGNKKEGNYIVVNYRTNGEAKIYKNDAGDMVADVMCSCHEGNNYQMFKEMNTPQNFDKDMIED